jgi:hypothetical protein
VVTCRTSRYQQLSERCESAGKVRPTEQQTTSTAGRREVVEDATVVSVQPLTAQSVVDYLTHRFQGSEDRSCGARLSIGSPTAAEVVIR